MANPLHVRLAATATRLINKHGRELTFLGAPAVGDSAAPWRGPVEGATRTEVVAIGAVLDYELKEIDGKLILRGDKRCLTKQDPNGFPDLVDSFDSSVWHVHGFETLNPGETVLLYDLQLRQ